MASKKEIKIIIDGYEILVNKADIKDLDLSKLYVNSLGYVIYGKYKAKKALHLMIMQPPPGMEVDHINCNKLDNRRENLRFCTHAENLMNRGKTRVNKSGYKGVRKNKKGKWTAEITAYKKRYWLGTFDTSIEAHKAYKAACKKLHKKFSNTGESA